MRFRQLRSAQSGVTLVELLIVIVVSTAVTIAILAFALSFWSSNATLENDLETFVTRADAGDILRDYLNESSGLITQNSIDDDHALAPDPGDASGQHWEIIHAVPKNVPIGSTGTITPVIYFQSPATDSSKSLIMNGAQPYTNEFVLYLNGTTKQLLLRSLANPGAASNKTRTSCPSSSATASCLADKIVADDISSVDTRYFSRSGNPIDYTSITDPLTGEYIGPDFSSVEVVELTLHLFRKSTLDNGEDTANSAIVRVAIRNR
jgi:Tfp pilus assembly protein PilW